MLVELISKYCLIFILIKKLIELIDKLIELID